MAQWCTDYAVCPDSSLSYVIRSSTTSSRVCPSRAILLLLSLTSRTRLNMSKATCVVIVLSIALLLAFVASDDVSFGVGKAQCFERDLAGVYF